MPDIKSNIEKWNNSYQWEHQGDEWSKVWGSVVMHWYGTIYPRIQALLPVNTILEIAPGYGRWTNYLKNYCKKLIAVDLSENCIEYCKKRFLNENHLKFYQNDGKSLIVAEENSIDFVFSYDSLVHGEIDVLKEYLSEFSRILTKNGIAFIHHSNRGEFAEFENHPDFHNHWRAKSVTYNKVFELAKKYSLSVITQELINWSNKPEWMIDCYSIITRAGSVYDTQYRLLKNGNFMIEARQWKPLSKIYDFSYLKTKDKTNVSIVIPVWNKQKLTQQCLENLFKTIKTHSFEIIIIDNASSDETPIYLSDVQKKCSNIKIIRNEENLGYAKANNQAAKIASGDYLVLLNNDTIPLPYWLDNLYQTISNDNNIGIVGAKLLYPDDFIQHCGVVLRRDRKFFKHPYKYVERDNALVNQRRQWDAVTAACLITPKKLFLELGGFDERYINGCEDIDYCCKVRQAGKEIWYEPKAELYHLESQTPRISNNDEKNFALFIEKWGDHAIKTEFDIFSEDGFWKLENSTYVHQYNTQAIKWHHQLENAQKSDNQNEKLRLSKLLKHLYTVEKWENDTISLQHNELISSLKISGKTHPKKLKILFVCHDFPPYRYAGAQIYAKNLAQAINQSGLAEVEIFHPVFRDHNHQPGEYELSQYEGLKVHKLYKNPNVFEYENINSKLVYQFFNKFLTKNHFDLVHFHGLGQLSASPIQVCNETNTPCVMTLHDYWFLCDEWHLMTPDQVLCSGPDSVDKCTWCLLNHHVDKKNHQTLISAAHSYKLNRFYYLAEQYNHINKLYAPSNYLKQKFNEYNFHNIRVNPLGFIIKKAIDKQSSDCLRFGYAGQIIRRKGVNLLVNSFIRLNHPKAQLHIWGKSYDEEFSSFIVKQCLTIPNIFFHGEYHPKDLPEIFANMDIAVIPSLMENYPLLVQEAFMYNTPVIASNAGGIPEAVKDKQNGLLFNAGDENDLLKKLNEIVNNPNFIQQMTQNIPGVKSINDDAEFYVNEYQRFKHKIHHKKKVLLYYFKNVHIPILKPIQDKLLTMQDTIELAIGFMSYAPDIRAGFTPEEMNILKSYNLPMFQIPQDFKPEVTVIADSVYPWVQNCGKLIHIGHGILCKGQYYTDTATARREEQADFVCVPGEYHANIMKQIISKPVFATGMAKLDDLYNGVYTREKVLKQYHLPHDFKYILFAPTFNDELSTIPYVMNRISDVIPDDNTYLLIKLHGSTKKKYRDLYKELAESDKRVIYIEDHDITPYLALADLMISDVSSAMIEFASLDKPLILFNNPNWHKYTNYNPDDIEFKFRHIAHQTNSLKEIKEAVILAFGGNDPNFSIRKNVTRQLINNIEKADATDKILNVILDA
ncbi:MAG TPA: glycosyltransferase [Candidatus Cloacimonadota bacterium]|nr:glycosyltransferase [Candidatus Cloacimonadota bacterium]